MIPQLVSLDLSHCNIKRVAARAFTQLTSLEKLFLQHNHIAELRQKTIESIKGEEKEGFANNTFCCPEGIKNSGLSFFLFPFFDTCWLGVSSITCNNCANVFNLVQNVENNPKSSVYFCRKPCTTQSVKSVTQPLVPLNFDNSQILLKFNFFLRF